MNHYQKITIGAGIMLFTVLGSAAYANNQIKQEVDEECLSEVETGTYNALPLVRFFKLKESCESYFPDTFRRGFLIIMSGSLSGAGACLMLGLMRRSPDTQDKVFGSASWASIRDIKKLKLLGGSGVFLGKLRDGRFLRHDGPEHCAVIAPTRTGKGAGVVVPTLLTNESSVIVYDLKEENFKITSGARSKFSDILYLSPSSPDSVHFNPLFEIRKGDHEVRDVQNIANMIIEPETVGKADHWIRTGNALLTAAILHVLYTSPVEERNLAGVTRFLSRGESDLVTTLREMMTTNHIIDPVTGEGKPHPLIVSAARDVLTKSANDMSGVHSTIMGYLSLYRDPILANNTKDSDFTIADIVGRERPVSLYIIVPSSDIERLRPFIRLLINQICRRLTEADYLGENSPRKHKLLLMLDEFPALGRLEFFETALGFLAGYGIKAVLISQSLNQLKSVYTERTSILDNTHAKVFFTANTPETARYVSESLGEATVDYQTKSHSGKPLTPYYNGQSVSEHIKGRSLMTAREVMEMPAGEAVVFIGGARPIYCDKIRYYEDGAFLPLLQSPYDYKNNKPSFPKTSTNPWSEPTPTSNTPSTALPIPQPNNQPSAELSFDSLVFV